MKNSPHQSLNVLTLTGIGIGGIIGAGYFLGSSLAIHEAGPSVVLAFLLGGVIMMQVLGAITSINVNRLARGSFRVYIERFLGPYFGFLIGWTVFTSGIFTLASEALASGTFFRYWLPTVPLPIISTIFLVLVIIINSFGVRNLGRIELLAALVKIMLLVFFIGLGILVIYGHSKGLTPPPVSIRGIFPNGATGFLQSMLVVIFAFSGISAIAMASSEVKDPRRDINRATIYTSIGITLLYAVSMLILVYITPWQSVYIQQSPFVQTFHTLGIKWAAGAINGVILIATFSVMAATYYASMQMLISLANAGKAPSILKRVSEGGNFFNAWLVVAGGSITVIAFSYVASHKLFNYLISASSYSTFLNWSLNLLVYLIWLKRKGPEETYQSPLILGRWGAYVTLMAIFYLLFISLKVPDFRTGFYAETVVVVTYTILYFVWSRLKIGKFS